MNDQPTSMTLANDDEDSDVNAIGASLKIDYAEIIALTEPDQPGGRIVFDSDDYDTTKRRTLRSMISSRGSSRLLMKRRNRPTLRKFSIIYAYLEATDSLPRGMVSVRAIRHGAEEDVLFRVEEERAIAGGWQSGLRTGHYSSHPE
jgi:hypothetical protein